MLLINLVLKVPLIKNLITVISFTHKLAVAPLESMGSEFKEIIGQIKEPKTLPKA